MECTMRFDIEDLKLATEWELNVNVIIIIIIFKEGK